MPKNDIYDSFCHANSTEKESQARPQAEFIQAQPPVYFEVDDSIVREADWENSVVENKEQFMTTIKPLVQSFLCLVLLMKLEKSR